MTAAIGELEGTDDYKGLGLELHRPSSIIYSLESVNLPTIFTEWNDTRKG
jgi:hypothetical protein